MAANADSDRQKREAARRALELVEPGMRLGLGTGSTARAFRRSRRREGRGGLDVRCVATSEATEAQARALGIPLATLDELPELDLTVDGADEIDPELRLIKGGGGALLREKIVAAASRRMAVIADATKLVLRLGAFPLAGRGRAFGLAATRRHIESAIGRLGLAGPIRSAGRSQPVRDRRRPLHPRLLARRDRRSGKPGGGAFPHPGRRRAWAVHRLRADGDRRRRAEGVEALGRDG